LSSLRECLFRYFPEDTEKITASNCQPDFNQRSPEYEAGVLTSRCVVLTKLMVNNAINDKASELDFPSSLILSSSLKFKVKQYLVEAAVPNKFPAMLID
jgi:hypothetical protein